MTSTDVTPNIICNTSKINEFKYNDNIKGSVLVTDVSSNVKVVPPGIDGQVFTSNSGTTLGVQWVNMSAGTNVFISNITGTIKTYANNTSYALYNPHTVVQIDVSNFNIESQFIMDASKLIAVDVIPAIGLNWPLGSNYTFDVGYLRGQPNINPPDYFGTITPTTCSFVPIAGTTLIVDNTYSNTRNSATVYLNVNLSALEFISMRCINNSANVGTVFTATIWVRSV